MCFDYSKVKELKLTYTVVRNNIVVIVSTCYLPFRFSGVCNGRLLLLNSWRGLHFCLGGEGMAFIVTP